MRKDDEKEIKIILWDDQELLWKKIKRERERNHKSKYTNIRDDGNPKRRVLFLDIIIFLSFVSFKY